MNVPAHLSTLAGLAAGLAANEVSAVEVTALALERIRVLDGRSGLNSFITVTPELALDAARASDARRAGGGVLGPLDGVPIALKDIIDTANVRTTGASRIWADRLPDDDAPVVKRLRAAGAVIVGKTNMLEFAYAYPHPDFGETVNPWDSTRTAGGSSGGSAAAVAAGLAWGALGTDTGGSIRSPAAYCGITGLKPTQGVVSLTKVMPLSWSLDHLGPMARTAEDCAILLAVIAGYDGTDPAIASPAKVAPVVSDVSALLPRLGAVGGGQRRPSPSLGGLRIGVMRQLFNFAVTPGLGTVVEESLVTLTDLGAELVEVELPTAVSQRMVPVIQQIYSVEAAAVHRASYEARPDDYGPVMRDGLRAALTVPAVDYVDAQRDRLRVRAAFDDIYARVDLLAWPAQPLIAPPLATTAETVLAASGQTPTIEVEIAVTGPANLTGEPSISLPCGFIDGLPVGLLLQAPCFADALLLRTAMAYQHSAGPPPMPPLSG